MEKNTLKTSEGADREARRIEALIAWYAILNKRTTKESEPVEPLTREEIYQTRLR